MNVYFISGIAADKRIFRRIELPAGFETIYIDWIKPLTNETLPQYANRLAATIDTSSPFILIGTSLGGIMATEIALKYRPVAVIIIGSISVASQLPGYFRLAGKMKLHKLVPGSFYKVSASVKHRLTREDADDKKTILQMIAETPAGFIRWGINAVLKWENNQVPKSLYHIHGTSDEMFPYKFTSPSHTISKGDHMIVITRHAEVNAMLAEILKQLTTSAH